ncbi:hypothetical protein DBT54_10205 [Aerococcus loyolae]|uniref:Uncharacterized protein n=1 Tax=Aerococcus urinae TaxID=1376 RepID=A0A329NV99_9LACT|nr:hypothetical protein DBT54_10205 [Aerococcus loyolae]
MESAAIRRSFWALAGLMWRARAAFWARNGWHKRDIMVLIAKWRALGLFSLLFLRIGLDGVGGAE